MEAGAPRAARGRARAIHAPHAPARRRRPELVARPRTHAAFAVHAAAIRRHRRTRHRAADRLRPDGAAALDCRRDDPGPEVSRRIGCWRSGPARATPRRCWPVGGRGGVAGTLPVARGGGRRAARRVRTRQCPGPVSPTAWRRRSRAVRPHPRPRPDRAAGAATGRWLAPDGALVAAIEDEDEQRIVRLTLTPTGVAGGGAGRGPHASCGWCRPRGALRRDDGIFAISHTKFSS